MGQELYIGLLSGTSMDSVDAALIDLSEATTQLLASHNEPIEPQLRERILQLCSPGDDEIDRAGVLDRELGFLFASAANRLLEASGFKATDILAIGSHGQTIRHRPKDASRPGERAFTWQIGDPNTIAECCEITTVADFRRRDIAAGGQGAPLVPLFHQSAFGKLGTNRAIVNIGGMSNISLLEADQSLSGFDTGPGNVLLDGWIEHHQGKNYDFDGAWSASGVVIEPVLDAMLEHPFFALPAPKSTGREEFNIAWLIQLLAKFSPQEPANIQATLAELTATSIAREIENTNSTEIFVCGGGAYNAHLMHRLQQLLGQRPLRSTAALGIAPEWVEASAFAWLASRALQGAVGSDARVTGATGARVLGAIHHR
jgi:anhydro-N-acetylmuramic acid kinase